MLQLLVVSLVGSAVALPYKAVPYQTEQQYQQRYPYQVLIYKFNLYHISHHPKKREKKHFTEGKEKILGAKKGQKRRTNLMFSLVSLFFFKQ